MVNSEIKEIYFIHTKFIIYNKDLKKYLTRLLNVYSYDITIINIGYLLFKLIISKLSKKQLKIIQTNNNIMQITKDYKYFIFIYININYFSRLLSRNAEPLIINNL